MKVLEQLKPCSRGMQISRRKAALLPPAKRGLLSDGAIAAAYAALVAVWSLLIRINGAPDELSHLFFVEYLTRFGSIPRPQIDPVQPFVGTLTGFEFQKSIAWYYGLPFAHVLGATAFAKIFSPLLADGDGYLAVRFFNWVLGAVFVFALIRTLLWSGLQSVPARLIAVLIAVIPQVTFIFAYFNHDGFGVTAVTLALYAFVRVVKNCGSRLIVSTLFGVCCGLVLLAKAYHYPALVFFALMFLLVRWTNPTFPLWQVVGRAVIACLAVATPMLAWTFWQFGEVTGQNMTHNFLLSHPEISSASRNLCYLLCENALANFSNIWDWSWISFISFFGLLGWMDLPLPDWIYRYLFVPLTVAFFVLSLSYFVEQVVRKRHEEAAIFNAGFVVLTTLMLLGTVLLSLYASQISAPQAQGRYLFVVLPFVAYCLALFALHLEAIGRLWQRAVIGLLSALAAGMLVLNLYAAVFIVAPANAASRLNLLFRSPQDTLALDLNALSESLSLSPNGLDIALRESTNAMEGWVDEISVQPGVAARVTGWAFDASNNEPAAAVVILNKDEVASVSKVGTWRPDVAQALGRSSASRSGFRAVFPIGGEFDPCSTRVIAFTSRLQMGELRLGASTCPKNR